MKMIGIFFALVLILSVIILPLFPDAYSQQSTRRLLTELRQEGRDHCMVWQINDFIYKPVRINIVFEPADLTVNIQSDDPESKVFWDASKESFQLVTSSTDRHRIDFELDYNIPQKADDLPRNVYYQIFAKDRTLMMDGNWIHDGDNFCIIIEFFTESAPTEITEEEIIEINNKFNAEQARKTAIKFTAIETGIIILLIVISVVGIMTTLYFVIILIHNRSMARVANRPVAKLDEMVVKIRKLADVFKLLLQLQSTENVTFREKIMNRIDESLFQLTIVASSEKRKKDVKEALPSATSLVMPSKPKSKKEMEEDKMIHKVAKEVAQEYLKSEAEVKPNTPEQEKENEETFAELYGVDSPVEPEPSATFADIIPEEEPEPEPKPKPKPEPIAFIGINHPQPKSEVLESPPDKAKTDENTVEIDPDKVKPCHCGEEPTFYCKDCGKYFCDNHEEHTCKDGKKIKKTMAESAKSSLGKIGALIAEKERKSSPLDDDKEISRLLHEGKSKREVVEMIVKEYMKIPFDEAKELHEKLTKEYSKDMTYPKALRIEASMQRLIASDK